MPCGLCSMLSELFSRACQCFRNRRSSTESYYKELGDQDTLKIEDKTSDSEDSIDSSIPHTATTAAAAVSTIAEMNAQYRDMENQSQRTGRFLTIHKRRKKRLLTRMLCKDSALLDDIQSSLIQGMLDQSALWKFNAFALDNVSGGRSLPVLCIHLFKLYGLITHFQLQPVRLWKLFTLIEEGYHSTNAYHNHVHAADVTQAMHCFLQQEKIRDHMEPLEIMASLIASIGHDVDHPGVNQPFLIATSNHLASLYKNTSVLENHHWRWAMSCVAESGVFDHMSYASSSLKTQISSLVLATDITRQQEFLVRFKEHLDQNIIDLRRKDHRHLILQIALKCSDISNPCRPWEISRKWSIKVCDEFFRQGDYERKLNLPVTVQCDRYTTSIPKIQAGFFQFVVTPLVLQWHRFLENNLSEQMLHNLDCNIGMWEQLLANEIAEEAVAATCKADVMDDDGESYSLSNISSSSELLIPPRRCSLNVGKLTTHDRRLSVPLNMRQDVKFKNKDRFHLHSSLASSKVYEVDTFDSSLHNEKVLSTEKLLPDSSIASITTPHQATRINFVLGKNSSKLCRQQTFPPLEARAIVRGYSQDEDSIQIKTDISQNYLDMTKYGLAICSKFFKKNDYKTDNDGASDISDCTYNKMEKKNVGSKFGPHSGRRESAPVGSQLRENLTLQPPVITKERLIHRRKSMPAEVGQIAPKENKGREWVLPQIMCRTISTREYCSRRRGSAPVGVCDIGALLGDALRHGVGAPGRRKHKDMQQVTACQQWIANTTYLQENNKSVFQRRGSLPLEVLQGGDSY